MSFKKEATLIIVELEFYSVNNQTWSVLFKKKDK